MININKGMTGYVKISKADLKVKELELYRGIYCSLCNALGRNYSVFARLLLSYDFAFAAMLKLALSPFPYMSYYYLGDRKKFHNFLTYRKMPARYYFCRHFIMQKTEIFF